VALYLSVCPLLAALPYAGSSLMANFSILISCGAILYGAATIITTIIPMLMSRKHETSTIAGFIDFAFNVGAGLAGVVVGTVIDRYSWDAVFFVLAASAVFTGLFLAAFIKWEKRVENAGTGTTASQAARNCTDAGC